MSSQVVRIQGFTKGSLSGIGQEAERGNVEHRNIDIDPNRKEMNMYFKQTEHGFYHEWNDIKTALNVQGKETKKGIAFEGMVVTADKEFYKERFGWEQGKPMTPDMVKYWKECYEYAKQEIGYKGTDKNIISAVVHADETTPHLQLYYLPITEKWQEKVYAKGEDGKVLRSERGTPIQAKDENGKTLYNQVENENSPKLARSEFWRVRGGQNSYSQMQDRFHEQIGKQYGLERGEVGSDKQHRTKNQWEQEQLTAEKERLTAEVTPYRELKQGIEEVETPGKTVLPGIVAVKKKDLSALKEQAKAYSINRDEIESVRERTATVTVRENRADQRERTLDNRENELAAQQQNLQQMYQRQLNLNQLLERSEKDRDRYKTENEVLKHENGSLKAEIERVRETLTKQIESLKKTVRGAYESLTNTVKAVGMLKYDKEDGYGIDNLTKKQEKLIDGIAEYGSHWAKTDGFPDLAEDMQKHVGISKGLRETIEPPKIEHHHDRGGRSM